MRPIGLILRYALVMDRVNSPSDLGAALRLRRHKLGLTQDDLALAIGVKRKVIGQLEGGKQRAAGYRSQRGSSPGIERRS